MSEQGFDAVARGLASGQISRRSALGRMLAGFFGLAAATGTGAVFSEVASAACPPARRCRGRCCPRNSRCRRGRCRCIRGYTRCGRKCVNLRSNRNHCGRCGRRCPDGKVCRGGQCVSTAPAQVCGNGVREGTEQCDGNDLGGATCASLGFASGQLVCRSDCTLDASGCSNPPQQVCGNGVIEGTEQCDGADFGGATCASLGFAGGTLACGPNCTFDTSGCTQPDCDADEDCPANPQNPCLAPVCDGGTCTFVADNGAVCDDGDPCTTNNGCSGGVCVGEPVVCIAPGPCFTSTCDPQAGCIHTPRPQGTSCGNGAVCDAGGNCVAATVCTPGEQIPCGASDVGQCQFGVQTCNAEGTGFGPCVGEVGPSPELCNGLDDDCDGVIDNGFDVGAGCGCGPGGFRGTKQCSPDGQGTVCFC